jgi:hypothetical protein
VVLGFKEEAVVSCVVGKDAVFASFAFKVASKDDVFVSFAFGEWQFGSCVPFSKWGAM